MRIMSELPGLGGDKPVHRIGGSDLCDLFGITPGMLTTLGKRDIVVRLGHDACDLKESARRYIASLRETASGRGGEEQVLNLTSERARLAREQALKNVVLRGEFVPAGEVERLVRYPARPALPASGGAFRAAPVHAASDHQRPDHDRPRIARRLAGTRACRRLTRSRNKRCAP